MKIYLRFVKLFCETNLETRESIEEDAEYGKRKHIANKKYATSTDTDDHENNDLMDQVKHLKEVFFYVQVG